MKPKPEIVSLAEEIDSHGSRLDVPNLGPVSAIYAVYQSITDGLATIQTELWILALLE
jgi:hypothetical protein